MRVVVGEAEQERRGQLILPVDFGVVELRRAARALNRVQSSAASWPTSLNW